MPNFGTITLGPMTYLVSYLATAIAFLVLDAVWLGLAMKSFYRGQLGTLMAGRINPWAAGLFYVGFVLGIVIFAVAPALRAESWETALLFGALFGFFTYGTYNMTNWATLRGWPALMSIVDLTWGTALAGGSALVGYAATRWLLG